MRKLAMAVAILAALALSGVALAAGTFANGNFEQGTYTANGSGFETLYAGSGAITDWTVTSGSVDWIGTYWQAPSGTTMSLDLNGQGPGAIAQTFTTTPGDTYVVDFFLAGNPSGGPTTKNLIVDASGSHASSQTYSFSDSSATTGTMGWTAQTYSFVASADTTTLTFAADPGNTGPYGPALGDVTVTQTAPTAPSTGAACKDGGWQTMRDGNGLPFRNQGACVSFYATTGATPIGR